MFVQIINTIKRQLAYPKDPRYVFFIIAATFIFSICFLQVTNKGLFDSVERPVFEYFNGLPNSLYDGMLAITQLGGLGGLFVWVPLAWYLINRRAALILGLSSTVAWFLAKVAKAIAERERPGDILAEINLFGAEKLSGFGFPSGHATVVAAATAFLYYQIDAKYRKYLVLTAILVGISRMYLGAHFPLDIVGGWALGTLIAAVTCTIFGISSKDISVHKLKKFMNSKGLAIQSLTFANVDARGSRPIFITTTTGKEYFGKIFGKREHAADWLFKIFRFFRFKDLQAEEPHLSSRRNVEIEGFSMLWAKQAGVRVAKLVDILNHGSYWISIQEKVDGKPLADLKRLTEVSLIDTWKQVHKLHAARIAHRDLRAANILIDKQGKAWLIDFGFAEASATNKRMTMDNAELLMSMSLVVGVKRTLRAATAVLNRQELKATIPYLQTAVFSGATTKQLSTKKDLLTDLKAALAKQLNLTEEPSDARVLRLNRKKALNLILMAVFIYVITPQLGEFADALVNTKITNILWLVPLTVASLATYVFTGLLYVTLADVPLRLREATLVQVASSFISKVMPGGLASTALNAKYMIKAGLSPIETSAVISSQAIISLIMFMVPLGLFLILNGTNIFSLVDLSFNKTIVLGIVVVIGVLASLAVGIKQFRTLLVEKTSSLLIGLRDVSIPPKELSIAAGAAFMVTVAYITCLYLSLQSVGLNIGISAVVIAYATATIAKSAVPTPGGLGPVEAALIATLIAFGADKAPVISAVLIYRLATFWIPIPFSVLAYKYIAKQKLI